MQTVGELLRTARESKGLTIKDVENGTSIRSLYLSAIEEGNYSTVPGEVYLKGFIRNYANFLGLNGQEMVNLYRQSQQPVEPSTEQSEPPRQIAAAARTTDTAASSHTGTSLTKPLLLGGLAVILLAGGFWLANRYAAPQPPLVVPSPAQPTPVPAAPQPTAPPAGTPSVQPATGTIHVTAAYNDQCWTMVAADGKEIYEGVVQAGQTLSWDAQQKLEIKLGNASAADITYNNQSIGKLGGKGEVIVKTFTANTGRP